MALWRSLACSGAVRCREVKRFLEAEGVLLRFEFRV